MSLPDSVLRAAGSRLHIEAGEILYSEDQGDPRFATLCVDRWLTARSGEIRMEVRIVQRESFTDDWYPSEAGSIVSEPLTEAQALQLVNHWCESSQAAYRLAQRADKDEMERFEAFGPRPPRPWEVAPAIHTKGERQHG